MYSTSFLNTVILFQCIPPPKLVDRTKEQNKTCNFVRMGFPTRESSDIPSLIHSAKNGELFGRTSYLCPRCKAKQAELPTDCAVCGLKLVLAPHLARSFHHLFPVPPFEEVSLTVPKDGLYKSKLVASCFSCLRDISLTKDKCDDGGINFHFKCPHCSNTFCAECDAYLHETLHNCPGCLTI